MISWAIQLREARPLSVTIRRWREICRKVFAEVGEKWKSENLPDHFNLAAGNKYRYKQRGIGYIRRKLKRLFKGKGYPEARRLGPIDLVYSGRMYRMVTKGAIVTPYPSRATITMPGPQYISGVAGGGVGRGMRVNKGGYIDPKSGKTRAANTRPNMAKEIMSDTTQQKLEIGIEIDRLLTEAINAETITTVEDL